MTQHERFAEWAIGYGYFNKKTGKKELSGKDTLVIVDMIAKNLVKDSGGMYDETNEDDLGWGVISEYEEATGDKIK